MEHILGCLEKSPGIGTEITAGTKLRPDCAVFRDIKAGGPARGLFSMGRIDGGGI